MIIRLYRNDSDKTVVNKNITLISEITGTLTDSCTIENPIILIDVSYTIGMETNYIYIPGFQRYYFVEKQEVLRTRLWQFYCKADVLMSFKTQLASCTAIVKKQENDWNLYLNDGSFRVYQNPMIFTKKFPSGFTSQSFVLSVAGG